MWHREPSLARRMVVGTAVGVGIGVLFLGVGLVRAVGALARGIHVGTEGLSVEPLLLYVASFGAGGLLVGALLPIATTRIGTGLVAFLAMLIVVSGVMLMDGQTPSTWDGSDLLFWVGFSGAVAVMVTFKTPRGGPAA